MRDRTPAGQSFGVSSGSLERTDKPATVQPTPARIPHLRGIFRETDELHEKAAQIRRAVDELDGANRRALLAWAELTEQAARSLRSFAMIELSAAQLPPVADGEGVAE